MLELVNIKKDYPAGGETVNALKGVSLKFRKSEFVSILGPSGCGKTTMLNIIGGLDQYTEGDLIINGTSTKKYKDRDWDTYRNHSIGFVFQSYNLIPHQSVLRNVELALTLSGVSKAERKKRAKEALEMVGLGSQIKKKPSEMSGGQMQRVAIARAIVNNPDIILADEPTGALDTETSVQVMDILKEISKDRLVIMVTHNPDIANKYSTRIINMLDGVITGDSNPLTEEEISKENACVEEENKSAKKVKMPSMSLFTSFGLSLKNLISKRGRTVLTSFAGSIGIIGIALIYAVSQGMTNYINAVQEDTLSSYPLTITEQHTDLGSLMQMFMESAASKEDHEKDAVYQKPAVHDLINAMSNLETKENDLRAFKAYIEGEKAKGEEENGLASALSGIQYTYNIDMLIYTKNIDGEIILSDTQALMQSMLMEHFSSMFLSGSEEETSTLTDASNQMTSMMSTMGSSSLKLWQEMLPGDNGKLVSDLLEKQYDVIYGSWPTEYNEIVIVVDANNEIDDMTLFALGLTSEEEMNAMIEAAVNKTEIEYTAKTWTYEEICDMEFRTILSSDCYILDESSGLYTDLRSSSAGLKYLYDNGTVLKVSGIIRPNEEAVSAMLTGSIGYTSRLTEYIVNKSKESSSINAQLDDPHTDIFTGLPFKSTDGSVSNEKKAEEFKAYVTALDVSEKADSYVKIMSIPSEEQLSGMVAQAMNGMTRETMEQTMLQALTQQTGMNEDEISSYISTMSDEDITEFFTQMVAEQIKMQYAAQVEARLSAMSDEQLAGMLDMSIDLYTAEQCSVYYDEILEFSKSSYEQNMRILGYVDLEKPSSVNLYSASFEEKDVIEESIAKYNEGVDDVSKITYTDYVGIMMSSITTIINAITYVLIAFVAVSLIVSSIMIGVITLISVQERTKEIGILRAIGASKKNVSSMFNAETVIIGFTSGVLGVAITYLLCIPINAILHSLTGINNLSAHLPLPVGVLLVAISVVLTLFAGIIPSRSASKKDPVVALRTE